MLITRVIHPAASLSPSARGLYPPEVALKENTRLAEACRLVSIHNSPFGWWARTMTAIPIFIIR